MSFYRPPYATVQGRPEMPSYHGQASAVLYPQSQPSPYVPQQSYGYPVHQLQGAQGSYKSGSGVQLNPTAVSYQPYSQPMKDTVYNPYLSNGDGDQYVSQYPNSYRTAPTAPANTVLNTLVPDGSRSAAAYSYLYRRNSGSTDNAGNSTASRVQQKETFGFSGGAYNSHYGNSEKTTSLKEPNKQQDGSTIEDLFKAKASQYGIDICTKAERIAKKVVADTDAARKEKGHQEEQQFHVDIFRQKAINCGIQIGSSKSHSEVLLSNLDINSNSEHFKMDIKKTGQSIFQSSVDYTDEPIVRDSASVMTGKRTYDTTVFASLMQNLDTKSEEQQSHGVSNSPACSTGDSSNLSNLKSSKLSVKGIKGKSNGPDVTDSSKDDDDGCRKYEEETVALETDGIKGNVVLETLKALCSAKVKKTSITNQKGKTGVQIGMTSSVQRIDEEQDEKNKYLYTFDDMVSDYVDNIIKNATQELALQKCFVKEEDVIKSITERNVECKLPGENICGLTSTKLEAEFSTDKNLFETNGHEKGEVVLKDINSYSHDIGHISLQPKDNTSQALLCSHSWSTCTSEDKHFNMVKDTEISIPHSELSSNENDSELDNRGNESDNSILNPSSPEFKPGTLKRLGIKGFPRNYGEISMRADAPVFKPSIQSVIYNPVPSLVVKSVKDKIVQTELKQYEEAAVNTKRTKQVSVIMETSSCDTREVCINTEESLFTHNSDFYTQVTTYSSQSTNTERQDCRSVGVHVRPSRTGEKKDKGCMTDPLDMYQRLLNTQRELLHLRGQVCIMELQRQLDDLERNKQSLVHAFLAVDDSSFEATINARIASLKIEINNIQIQLLGYDEELKDGNTWETVPQFSLSVPVGPTNIRVVNKNSFFPHVKFSWSEHRQGNEKHVSNTDLKCGSENHGISANIELNEECIDPKLSKFKNCHQTEKRGSSAGSCLAVDSLQQKAVCPLENTDAEVSTEMASSLSLNDGVDTTDKGNMNIDTLASSFELNNRRAETLRENEDLELMVGENLHIARSQDMSEKLKDETCDTVSLSSFTDANLRPCRSASSSSFSSSKSTTNPTTASALIVQAESVINHTFSETVINQSVSDTGTRLSRCSITNIQSQPIYTQHSVSSNLHSPVSVVASTCQESNSYEERKTVRNVVTSQFIHPEDAPGPSTSSSHLFSPQVVIAPRVIAVQTGVAFTVPPPPPPPLPPPLPPPPLPPPPSLSQVPPKPFPLVTSSQPHSFSPSNFLPFSAISVPRMTVPVHSQLGHHTPTINSHSQTRDKKFPENSNQRQMNVETTELVHDSVCSRNNIQLLANFETPLSDSNTSSLLLRPNSDLVFGAPSTTVNSSAILKTPVTIINTSVSPNSNSEARAPSSSNNMQKNNSNDASLSSVPGSIEHQDNQSPLLGTPSLSSNTRTGHLVTSRTTMTQTNQSHGRPSALSSASKICDAQTLQETLSTSQRPAVEQIGLSSSDINETKCLNKNSDIPPAFSLVSLQAPTNYLDQQTPALVSNSSIARRDDSAMPVTVTAADKPTLQAEVPLSINPGLHKIVLSQLKQVYPDLATNPFMLNTIALQQTQILQCYVAAGNMGGGLPDLSNLDPSKMLSLSSSMGSLPMDSFSQLKNIGESHGPSVASVQNIEGSNSDATSHGFKKPPGLGDPDVSDSIPDVNLLPTKKISPRLNALLTEKNTNNPGTHEAPEKQDILKSSAVIADKSNIVRPKNLLDNFKKIELPKDVVLKVSISPDSPDSDGKNMPPLPEAVHSGGLATNITRRPLITSYQQYDTPENLQPCLHKRSESEHFGLDKILETRSICSFETDNERLYGKHMQTVNNMSVTAGEDWEEEIDPYNIETFRLKKEAVIPKQTCTSSQQTSEQLECSRPIPKPFPVGFTTKARDKKTGKTDWWSMEVKENSCVGDVSQMAYSQKVQAWLNSSLTPLEQNKQAAASERLINSPDSDLANGSNEGLLEGLDDIWDGCYDKEKIDDISDISLPFSAQSKVKDTTTEGKIGKENEDDGEDWQQVSKKKKKSEPTASRKRMASGDTSLSSKQKSNNFEKLVTKMSEVFSTLTRSEIIQVITEVRTQMGGLSGLTMLKILEKSREVIDKKMLIRSVQHPPTQPTDTKVQVVHSLRPALLPTPSSKPKSTGYTQVSRDIFHPNAKTVLSIPGKTHTTSKPLSMSVLPSGLSKYSCDEEEDICVICHDGLSTEETKSLDCGHVFHTMCIRRWVLGRERTCPTCRRLALFPEEFPRLGK